MVISIHQAEYYTNKYTYTNDYAAMIAYENADALSRIR